MSTTNLIAELKKSPMFHLSLSSKELFHSNMLAWIAEDEDTKELFIKILKLFGIEDKAQDIAEGLRGENPKYMVLREYKNFDLCICEKIKNWKWELANLKTENQEGITEQTLNISNNKTTETKIEDEEFIPGQILLILENKFKSIPYKAQLKEYETKVKELNKEGYKNLVKSTYIEKCKRDPGSKRVETLKKELIAINAQLEEDIPETHFVLLSLAENIYEFEGDNNKSSKWKKVGYNEYAQELLTWAPNLLTKENQKFKCDVIVNYATYVQNFCTYLKNELPQNKESNNWTNEPWTKILASNTALQEIRMDDIWQKLITNHILIKLCEKGKANKLVTEGKEYCISTKDEDFVEDAKYIEFVKVAANFSRGTALINIIIHIGNNCVFGVQIQNGLYKRFLGTTTKHIGTRNLDGKIKYYCDKLDKLSGMFRYKETSDWNNPENNNGELIFDVKTFPDKKHQNKGLKHESIVSLHGFGGYGATFLAQWRKISEKASVENVLEAMINDCLEVRKKYPISPN